MPTILPCVGPISAATKPPVRRPTLVRKHDEIDDRSSPPRAKKVKVTFDDNVEVKSLEEWEKAPALVQEEVKRALQMHAIGDDFGYNEVKNIYDPSAVEGERRSPNTLKNYTTALRSNVSALDKSCSSLVYAVLKSTWIDEADDYVREYVRLLANLMSQGKFRPDVLDMLVQTLIDEAKPRRSRSDEPSNFSHTQVQTRVHSALERLLHSTPSASHTLSSILGNKFPHQDDSQRAHTNYVNILLKIVSYVPELRGDVLAHITDRLVKIDVQVQVDIEDLADDIGENLIHDLPQMRNKQGEDHEDSDLGDDDSDLSESDDDDEDSQRTKVILRNVEKMDLVLDALFRYYHQDFSANSITVQRSALESLLSQFITIILPAHRSRHTQFLLFHFAQTSPEFVDTFVGTCVHVAFDKGQTSMRRQAAAAYLASFVARGSQVPANIVRDVFDYIGVELDRLRTQYEDGCKGPDLRRYASYYSLMQALLYIFCFRWRDLQYNPDADSEDEEFTSPYEVEHRWRSGVKETLALNIFSTRLNPLKVCSPAIVTEFAKIANHLGILYVYGLLETNKRIHLSQRAGSYGQLGRETALSARRDESQYHLDEYFPFDPYHLPRSKKWVEGDYREWSGIPGVGDDQVDDSESEDDEGAESELDEGTATDTTKASP